MVNMVVWQDLPVGMSFLLAIVSDHARNDVWLVTIAYLMIASSERCSEQLLSCSKHVIIVQIQNLFIVQACRGWIMGTEDR